MYTLSTDYSLLCLIPEDLMNWCCIFSGSMFGNTSPDVPTKRNINQTASKRSIQCSFIYSMVSVWVLVKEEEIYTRI